MDEWAPGWMNGQMGGLMYQWTKEYINGQRVGSMDSGIDQPLRYLLVISYTTTATVESLIYDGIKLRNLSCPAVSQS